MKIKFTLLLFFIFLAVNNCATLKKQKYVAQSEILETDTTIQKPPVELPDISTAIETTAVQIAPTPKWGQYNSLLFFDMSMTTIYDDQYNDSNSLISAINYSLQYLNKLNDKSIVNFGADSFTINHLKESLIDFKEKLLLYDFTETFYEYVRENFCFYKSNADTVLFTGYYEPLLFGSFVKTDKYRYPLYRVPDNFYKIELAKYPFYSKFNGLPKVIRGRIQNKSILPFYTREEIDYKNALYGKDLEIVWCDNDIDVFFLHIQGSGIVQISDTQFIRVNYAVQNGHQYKPIGKYLIDKGLVAREDMSMQTLKKYLVDHPEEKQEIFSYNPSYVFFRIVDTGPPGNI
ncbi:MAG TPA: MltA domain-containing protein, partial [bacterium]|nr:MltA domain-containing protein [bacterium]